MRRCWRHHLPVLQGGERSLQARLPRRKGVLSPVQRVGRQDVPEVRRRRPPRLQPVAGVLGAAPARGVARDVHGGPAGAFRGGPPASRGAPGGLRAAAPRRRGRLPARRGAGRRAAASPRHGALGGGPGDRAADPATSEARGREPGGLGPRPHPAARRYRRRRPARHLLPSRARWCGLAPRAHGADTRGLAGRAVGGVGDGPGVHLLPSGLRPHGLHPVGAHARRWPGPGRGGHRAAQRRGDVPPASGLPRPRDRRRHLGRRAAARPASALPAHLHPLRAVRAGRGAGAGSGAEAAGGGRVRRVAAQGLAAASQGEARLRGLRRADLGPQDPGGASDARHGRPGPLREAARGEAAAAEPGRGEPALQPGRPGRHGSRTEGGGSPRGLDPRGQEGQHVRHAPADAGLPRARRRVAGERVPKREVHRPLGAPARRPERLALRGGRPGGQGGHEVPDALRGGLGGGHREGGGAAQGVPGGAGVRAEAGSGCGGVLLHLLLRARRPLHPRGVRAPRLHRVPRGAAQARPGRPSEAAPRGLLRRGWEVRPPRGGRGHAGAVPPRGAGRHVQEGHPQARGQRCRPPVPDAGLRAALPGLERGARRPLDVRRLRHRPLRPLHGGPGEPSRLGAAPGPQSRGVPGRASAARGGGACQGADEASAGGQHLPGESGCRRHGWLGCQEMSGLQDQDPPRLRVQQDDVLLRHQVLLALPEEHHAGGVPSLQ
mmetsp:Transcript_25990/g.77415  ORF Transcript_25990/g.77415 Transcript_25990/m.77415 type:complete len:719 (+) Transcript_25990:637-2793(+)